MGSKKLNVESGGKQESVDECLKKVEALTAKIKAEKSFDKMVESFVEAANLVKSALGNMDVQKGKITELVQEINGLFEKELRVED